MSQYQAGKVLVTSGSQVVKALWELILGTASQPFHAGCRLEFSPSTAVGTCLSHDPGTNLLVMDLAAGSPDPVAKALNQPGDSIGGAVAASIRSFLSATNAADRINAATGVTFTAGQHNGRWVRVALGVPGSEVWRKIATTGTTYVTVSPNFPSTPPAGSMVTIHENQTLSPVAFRRGTPQDFVAGGVLNGNVFFALGNSAGYVVATPAARTLTLASAYSDPRLTAGQSLATPYAVHKSKTLNRGYQYYESGDIATASVNRECIIAIDADIHTLFGSVGGGPPVEAFKTLGLGPAVLMVSGYERPMYYKDRQLVVCQGLVTKASPGWQVGDVIGAMLAPPNGYNPNGKLSFGRETGRLIEVWPDATVRYAGPDNNYIGALSVCFCYRIGGSVAP